MINPQKENGYTAISNELMDEMVRLRLSGSEWQIMMFVIRKTYGYNKKSDVIALSQFEKGCLLQHSLLCKRLKLLVSKRILVKTGNVYCLNKYYNEWVVSEQTVSKQTVSKRAVKVVSKRTHTITSITKDIYIPTPQPVEQKKNIPEKTVWLDFVKLTDLEYSKLTENLTSTIRDEYMERLNLWIGGKSEAERRKLEKRNHYFTILKWVSEDKKQGKFKTEKESLQAELARIGNQKFIAKYGRDMWESTPSPTTY